MYMRKRWRKRQEGPRKVYSPPRLPTRARTYDDAPMSSLPNTHRGSVNGNAGKSVAGSG